MADDDEKRDVAAVDRSDRRRAARIATFVAVPVTLLAAFGAFNLIAANSQAEDADDSDTTVSAEPVAIEVPEMSENEFEVCRALVSVIPSELGDLQQRPVEGGPGAAEVGAAWGDPAVTMVCGVDPIEVSDTDQVYRLSDACWYADETDEGTVWTTVDRQEAVQLFVPGDHDGSGQLATSLSGPIDEKVPAADEEDVPTGCYQ